MTASYPPAWAGCYRFLSAELEKVGCLFRGVLAMGGLQSSDESRMFAACQPLLQRSKYARRFPGQQRPDVDPQARKHSRPRKTLAVGQNDSAGLEVKPM